MNYKKDFDKWNNEKKKVNSFSHKAPFVKEGELWWARIGENIGSEISGKSEIFTRPVLILKKLSSEMFLIIPITTQQKEGSWYVTFRHHNIDEVAVLSQVRTISYKRLGVKMGQIDGEDFKKVKQAFKDLFY